MFSFDLLPWFRAQSGAAIRGLLQARQASKLPKNTRTHHVRFKNHPAQLQPLLRHGRYYGDVLITQDALDCCQREDDLYAALEHHMDLGFFLFGLDRATKANVSQFTCNSKPVKSAFVLEAGVLNITTDPAKGVNVVSGSDEVIDLD